MWRKLVGLNFSLVKWMQSKLLNYDTCHILSNTLCVSGDNFKGSDIVDAVGRVCQSYTSSTYTQLKQLLQEDELDRWESVLYDTVDQVWDFYCGHNKIYSFLFDSGSARWFFMVRGCECIPASEFQNVVLALTSTYLPLYSFSSHCTTTGRGVISEPKS